MYRVYLVDKEWVTKKKMTLTQATICIFFFFVRNISYLVFVPNSHNNIINVINSETSELTL